MTIRADKFRTRRKRIVSVAAAVAAHPLFAYPAVFALELRFIWGIWSHKDTTAGDTSYYYLEALEWAQHLRGDIVLSPLYTSYLGTITWFVHDAATAVMAHRILLVLSAAVLVLAVGRALLGPTWGLLLAVWWAVVPSNFNVDYEVHLLGFFPVLVAILLVARSRTRAARGAALGCLVAGGFLIRQELFIAAAIFAVGIIFAEWRHREPRVRPSAYVLAYALPLLVAAVLATAAILRSPGHGAYVFAELKKKHDLNTCQIYAYNYQQRHPTQFPGNPFTDCAPLMRRVFGRSMPSFTEALRANPRAIGEFVAWNLQLTPIGLQVALFGATSRGVNPGYFPVKAHRRYSDVLTVLALVIVVLGVATMLSERAFWLGRIRERAWPLLILVSMTVTGMFVALTQRPRGEYIYGLTLTLMVLTLACIAALVRRARVAHVVAAATALVPVVLILALPSYFEVGPTPLHDALKRLARLHSTMERSDTVLITSGYNWEICAYFAKHLAEHCSSPSWQKLQQRVATGEPVDRVLGGVRAKVIYADPNFRLNPKFAAFVDAPPSSWRPVASGKGRDGLWSVLVRR